jgi:hypothetical protein
MKSVLDSSVAIKWVLIETDTDKARRLRDEYRQGQHQLIAPDWFNLEVMTILGKAAARKTITAAQAMQSGVTGRPLNYPAGVGYHSPGSRQRTLGRGDPTPLSTPKGLHNPGVRWDLSNPFRVENLVEPLASQGALPRPWAV